MKHKRRVKKSLLNVMDSNSKDEECHIVLSPETSPIYGGGILEIIFRENSILPADDVEFYVVFWGLTARHITSAIRKDYRTLEVIVPGHDRFEDAHLAVCALQPSFVDVRVLAKSNFIFSPDSTFYLAQFLASSVWDPDSLDNPQAIKSEHFDLQAEDRSTLDSRLTAAFQHLEFPPSWNLVVDSGRLDENPPPRETLLHFATRLSLISFAEHLLDRRGCTVALRLQNKNGELPYHIAKGQGLHKLADRMLQLAQNEDITKQRIEGLQTKPSKVKQHNSFGTASITTKVHESKRSLEDDIQMLREIMSSLKDEGGGGEVPQMEIPPDETNIKSASPDTMEEVISPTSSDGEAEERDVIDAGGGDVEENEAGDEDEEEEEQLEEVEEEDDEDDVDENNDSEEADEMADSVSLDEDLSRLRAVTNKVQRFKEQNRPWMSSAEERREKLSRFSTSCPVLMEEGKHGTGWTKENLPSLPSAIDNSSEEEEVDDGCESGNRSPRIQIQVNDTVLDSSDDQPVVTVPTIEDAVTPPLSSEEGEDLSATRRHSWGDQAKEMKSPEGLAMASDMRCRSMLNLDSGARSEEFHRPKERLITASLQQNESQSIKNDNSKSSAEKASVKFQDGLSDTTDPEPDVSSILPPDNASESGHTQVVRRRKKTSKEARKQKSASMFEARSDDSADSLPSDDPTPPERYMLDNPSPSQSGVVLDSIPYEPDYDDADQAEKKRRARLSLAEFLNDNTNFMEEESGVAHKPESNNQRSAMLRKFSFLKVGGSKREKKKYKDKDRDEKDTGGENQRNRTHQFVQTSFSNSSLCNCCNKPLLNKAALQCQACSASVHLHCKDSAGPCSKLTKHPKGVPKSSTAFKRIHSSSSVNLSHVSSFQEKPRPTADHNENASFHQQSSQSFPKSAFQGSSPDLRSPNSGNSFSWSYELGKWHWHRVAVKLGVNRTIDENEEAEERPGSPPKQSAFQNSLSCSMESLDDVSGEALQIEDDEDLTTGPEPESWSATVEKKTLKKMSNKEIKRQDVIFEFIMTEKHHLRTLKVMQKIFSYGMTHELSMDQSIVSKVFPSLGELVDISSLFYDSLKARQVENLAVEKIGDVLCKHFEGANGDLITAAYGSLCSRQKEAVSVYKDLQKTDRKFQSFIKKCSTNALCRRWSIPECILSVSHRLTKYQLLIEAIIKPTKATKADKVDTANLERALALIKGICNEVDLKVEEHEKWQRLIDIYNKMEARATAPMKNGKKFKKSDLLSNNRKFIKEGELFWKSARGRLTEVHVVIISDLLLLLSENNQKYTFASQDSKPPVISLENLMVRDVAIDTKSIYIISRYKQGPEMYEISCKSSQDRDEWKKAIEKAVKECPVQEETAEEEKRLAEEKLTKMGKILEDWKETDKQLLNIITTKMKMSKELRELALSREDVSSQVRAADKDVKLDEGSEVLQAAIKEASFLQSSIYQNPNYLLGRSASSAGERDSQTMYLPKRAETFSGFDATTAQGPNKRSTSNVLLAESSARSSSFPNLSNDEQISQGTPSPLLPDDSDISREEDDVLSPMSPLNRDSPQRSPLPHRRASERSTDSTSSGRRDSTELSRTRSHTVSTTVSNKVQFNVPSEENKSGSRQDLQEGEEVESLATGGFNPEQLQSVNQLMKYFYLLLPILSQKDHDIETLKNKLAEAQNEIETLKSHSQSLVETRKNPSSAPASPAGQDLRGRTASTRSLQEKSDHQGMEKLNNQRSLPEGSIRQEQLTRIAFGDNLPSNQLIRYRNHSQSTYPKDINTSEGSQNQSLQVGSVNKNRYSSAEMITGRLMWNADMEPPPPISTSSNNRRQTPTHLMSATNEQAGQSSTVKQQLPLQLSKGSAGPKTSQQVLPKKLSSGTSKSSLSQKGKNNFTEGQQADEVIFF